MKLSGSTANGKQMKPILSIPALTCTKILLLIHIFKLLVTPSSSDTNL